MKKKPAVLIQFRKGLVHSVDAVDESSIPELGETEGNKKSDSAYALDESIKDRRDYARFRKSTMVGTPIPPAISHGWSAGEYLEVLDRKDCPIPKFIPPIGNVVSNIKIPKRLPRDSSFLVTVEWPLRPGDSRVEAYFIGANKRSKYWFLIECTIDDLSSNNTRYLDTRATALIEKKGLEIEEAAILLLRCAWQYENNIWDTSPFFLVTEDGLVDTETAFEIADLVWPDEKEEGQRYEPEVLEVEEEEQERPLPVVAYGSGYILRASTMELKDNVSMKEFAEAFPFFNMSGWALMFLNSDRYLDGFGYKFITYQIKARLGKYLKRWDSYEIYHNVEEPSFPDWLDAEYNPDTGCYYFYGGR